MVDLRGSKLIAASVLAGAGCVSIAIGERGGGLGLLLGFILLLTGLSYLARQWLSGASKSLMPALSPEHELETLEKYRPANPPASDSEQVYVKSPRRE
jgi:hypothetical protein